MLHWQECDSPLHRKYPCKQQNRKENDYVECQNNLSSLNKDAYKELYDEWESGCAYLEVYLEQYPELISQLPISELWALDPWERLMLLIRCTENAAIIKQTLEGNDIWATTLPILEPEIQQKAAALCPWETLTASQKRYMSLKSPALKKIISEL